MKAASGQKHRVKKRIETFKEAESKGLDGWFYMRRKDRVQRDSFWL